MKKLLLITAALTAVGLFSCQNGPLTGSGDPEPVTTMSWPPTDPGFWGVVRDETPDPPKLIVGAEVNVWCCDCETYILPVNVISDELGQYDATDPDAYYPHEGAERVEIRAWHPDYEDFACCCDHGCPLWPQEHDIDMTE